MTKRASIRLGTSAFTADGWEGVFYPQGTKPADYLSYYSAQFDTVEIDSTYYRTPSASTGLPLRCEGTADHHAR